MTDDASCALALADFIARHGPWTAHDIRLADGVYTIGAERNENHLLYLKRIVTAVRDASRKPLSQLRVLDLGALEGGFAIEFAMQGSQVVAVEGRRESCDRIEFAKQALGLDSLTVVCADVRDAIGSLGQFDVILCLGLLYHLDRGTVCRFLADLFAHTDHLCVLDTHVALFKRSEVEFEGRRYFGADIPEHPPGATPEQKAMSSWASLDNDFSFYFTEASLCNFLTDIGFSSVGVCMNPFYRQMLDRKTFVATKHGEPLLLASNDHRPVMSERHSEERDMRVVEPINTLPLPR